VRCFPMREAAIRQDATDARPAGLRGRAGPTKVEWGEGERRLGKEKGSGPRLGQKPELGPIQVIKPF
jgi:hypothetical protein